MLDLFKSADKEKIMENAKRFWEKGKHELKKAWEEIREEHARRERERALEEEYAAEFRYQDEEMEFVMLISFEEAELYEKAKKKWKEVKKIHSDPRVHKQWESKKYLSLHHHFTDQIEYYEKRLQEDPTARHRWIRYCERQIHYAPVAAKAYRMDPYTYDLPEHPGYLRLVDYYEKEGDKEKAIQLCQKAMKEGWKGDWAARMASLRDSLPET